MEREIQQSERMWNSEGQRTFEIQWQRVSIKCQTVFQEGSSICPQSLIFLSYVCVHTQLCQILHDPMDCIPPGSSVHGIFQARILQWVAISFSRGSSQPRHRTHISCVSYIGRQLLYQLSHQGSPVSFFCQ